MGTFERAAFFTLVFMKIEGQLVAVGLVAWLAAKMLVNWNRSSSEQTQKQFIFRIRGGESALLAGILSVTFGIVGGVIANGSASELIARLAN